VIISNINGLAAEFMACGLKERGMFAVTTTAEIDADPLARVLRVNLSGALLGAKQGPAQVLVRGEESLSIPMLARPLRGTGRSDVRHVEGGHLRYGPQFPHPIRQAGGFVRWA
jgi:hypothetical protein